MNDGEGFRRVIPPGHAARRHESQEGGPRYARRIEGGTAAKKSESEARSSVMRSSYSMKISAQVGRPFTLESERTAPGECRPAEEPLPRTHDVAIQRDVVLSPGSSSARPAGEHSLGTADSETAKPLMSGSEQSERREGSPEGVSRLRDLLPRAWFSD